MHTDELPPPATCESECSALLNLTALKPWDRMRMLRSDAMKLSSHAALICTSGPGASPS